MGLARVQPRLDRAAVLAWKATQATKHEFIAGDIFAVVGARQEHVLVSLALAARLREHLRGTRCRAYTSDMKLEVLAADAVSYPDVMVSCDETDRQRPQALQAPCRVVEVLSESTAAFDRGAKFAAYRQLASLQEYLLVDIERQQLELFRRETAGWVLHEPEGEPRRLWLASVDLQLLPQALSATLTATRRPRALRRQKARPDPLGLLHHAPPQGSLALGQARFLAECLQQRGKLIGSSEGVIGHIGSGLRFGKTDYRLFLHEYGLETEAAKTAYELSTLETVGAVSALHSDQTAHHCANGCSRGAEPSVARVRPRQSLNTVRATGVHERKLATLPRVGC